MVTREDTNSTTDAAAGSNRELPIGPAPAHRATVADLQPANPSSAGMDLASSNTVTLLDWSVHLIPTGVFGPPRQCMDPLFVCSPWGYRL